MSLAPEPITGRSTRKKKLAEGSFLHYIPGQDETPLHHGVQYHPLDLLGLSQCVGSKRCILLYPVNKRASKI
jgi:hypothetical protein